MIKNNFDFKNALFFPYGYEFAPILNGLLTQKLIDTSIKLISPEGWGLSGLDAGEAFGRPKIGIKISNDLENEMKKSRSFIAVPFKDTGNEETNQFINLMIDENIQLAKSMKLNVLDLREIVGENIPGVILNHRIEINCPIVFVNGLTENLNKLDVMMELYHSLTKKGYKISLIGTRHYCNIINMNAFPQFMFDTISESKKVKLFRTFVHNVYHSEKPDLLIVGIPGASVPFNDDFDSGYGIMHFLVSMAVRADFSITCTNFGYCDVEKIHMLFTYRFRHGIDCVILSNTQLIYNPEDIVEKLNFGTLDFTKVDEFINKHAAKSKFPIYNIFNKNNVESLSNLVVEKLGDVECFAL